MFTATVTVYNYILLLAFASVLFLIAISRPSVEAPSLHIQEGLVRPVSNK
jgi:hypothetical protein